MTGKGPPNYRDLAHEYLQTNWTMGRHKTLWVYEGDVWVYENGTWKEASRNRLVLQILGWLGKHKGLTTDRHAQEVFRNVMTLRMVNSGRIPGWIPPVAPSIPDYWIVMQNCMVAPEGLAQGLEDAVRERTPRYVTPVILPYEYDPEATCPQFDSFLSERLAGDQQLIDLQWEFFGYWLTMDTSLHAALFLIGGAGTGKSTVMKVAGKLLGPYNTTHMSLQSYSDKFKLAYLKDKLLNIADEIGPVNAQVEAALKWWTSGEPIVVERKYRDPQLIYPTARLVVGVNNTPDFRDETGAIWRRLYFIPYKKKIDRTEMVRNFADRFDEELPGIFNRAIEGLTRLRQQGHFTVAESGEAVRREEMHFQLAHAEFIVESLSSDEEGVLYTKELAGAYKAWCKEHGVTARLGPQSLRKTVDEYVPGVQLDARDHAGKRCMKGVRLRG